MGLVRSSGTIFSLSSGKGRSAVAVVRVSGPNAVLALKQMTKEDVQKIPPRFMKFTKIVHATKGTTLDRGMVVWFPGPKSFTGEDCCEFQVHGGTAVLNSLLDSLGRIPGFRPAEAGEFTKRAFLAGKLDLTKVEGLADLLTAETEAQLKLALRQAGGELEKLYKKWRRQLIKCIANAEAYIDFAEDENIEDGVMTDVQSMTELLVTEIKSHLADNRRGERLRDGVQVAIVGEPNVGKSSLLNLLCQRPAAIVSEIPGTTRDILETTIDIGGYPMILCDTAGIRFTTDPVEKEGVARAKKLAEEADLVILVRDASEILSLKNEQDKSVDGPAACRLSYASSERKIVISETSVARQATTESLDFNHDHGGVECSRTVKTDVTEVEFESDKKEDMHGGLSSIELLRSCKGEVMTVWNKIDLVSGKRGIIDDVTFSCQTKEGIQEFMEKLQHRLARLCADPDSASPVLTKTRHRTALERCLSYLEEYRELSAEGSDLVISVHKLRCAVGCIGSITGEVYTDDVLDVIFSDFCIGK